MALADKTTRDKKRQIAMSVTAAELGNATVKTVMAVLGRSILPPGLYPTNGLDAGKRCVVEKHIQDKIVSEKQNITIDTSDCTIFRVHHVDETPVEPPTQASLDRLMEQSINAVSQLIIWSKCKDVAGVVSPYDKQVGRIDVKFFALEGNKVCRGAWANPRHSFAPSALSMIMGFLGNMVVTPNPITSPVTPIARRLMSCLDLFNSGFYTDAFVSAFSLLDDLVQTTLEAGLGKRGLDSNQQTELLRAIKEQRLKHYTCTLAAICGWESLDKSNSDLYKRLIDRKGSTNNVRNNIMHGDTALGREQARQHINNILEAIAWLRDNPFGYAIDPVPPLKVAESPFVIFDVEGRQVEPPLPDPTPATDESHDNVQQRP
jgi:hypothetical protein